MVRTTTTGKVLFRVFLPHASRVELVGDFTDWRTRAVSLARQNPGWWSVEVDLKEGQHDFCYLVDGSIWLADYAADGVRLNGYGGWVSQVRVSARPVRPASAPVHAVAA